MVFEQFFQNTYPNNNLYSKSLKQNCLETFFKLNQKCVHKNSIKSYRKIVGSPLDTIEVIENGATAKELQMETTKLVEAASATKSGSKHAQETLSSKKVVCRETKSTENDKLAFLNAKMEFNICLKSVVNSKALTFMFLASYIVICLFGNIVTGIIIIKHHLSSKEDIEGMNNLTQTILNDLQSDDIGIRVINNSSPTETMLKNITDLETDETVSEFIYIVNLIS